MIGIDDALYTVEFKDHYEIVPDLKLKKIKLANGNKVKNGFFYSSNNTTKISSSYLKKEILKIEKNLKL